MLLVTAITTTMAICVIKLDTPRLLIFARTFPEIRKHSLSSLMLLNFRIYATYRKAFSICPIMVAQAAPFTPQWNTKMKTGSRIMLVIHPASSPAMLYFGLPSARIIPAMPESMEENRIPNEMIRP